MIEISRRDINSIIESMGHFDGIVSFIEDFHKDTVTPAIILSITIAPLFWITIATWYCEQEHTISRDFLPDWVPIDWTTFNFTRTTAYGTNVLIIDGFKVVD